MKVIETRYYVKGNELHIIQHYVSDILKDPPTDVDTHYIGEDEIRTDLNENFGVEYDVKEDELHFYGDVNFKCRIRREENETNS